MIIALQNRHLQRCASWRRPLSPTLVLRRPSPWCSRVNQPLSVSYRRLWANLHDSHLGMSGTLSAQRCVPHWEGKRQIVFIVNLQLRSGEAYEKKSNDNAKQYMKQGGDEPGRQGKRPEEGVGGNGTAGKARWGKWRGPWKTSGNGGGGGALRLGGVKCLKLYLTASSLHQPLCSPHI